VAEPADLDRDPAPAPGATPKQGAGCAWLLVAVPIAVVVGIVVGTLLSRSDGEEEVRTTLAQGEGGGLTWQVDAVRDIDGDRCAFLLVGGEQVTGGCTTRPQGVTFGPAPDAADGRDVTVVFGLAPRDAIRLRLGLAEGGRTPDQLTDPDDQPEAGAPTEPIDVDTVDGGPVGGRYYVVEVPGGVHPTGTVEVLAE
jgi:hypothetical protein